MSQTKVVCSTVGSGISTPMYGGGSSLGGGLRPAGSFLRLVLCNVNRGYIRACQLMCSRGQVCSRVNQTE